MTIIFKDRANGIRGYSTDDGSTCLGVTPYAIPPGEKYDPVLHGGCLFTGFGKNGITFDERPELNLNDVLSYTVEFWFSFQFPIPIPAQYMKGVYDLYGSSRAYSYSYYYHSSVKIFEYDYNNPYCQTISLDFSTGWSDPYTSVLLLNDGTTSYEIPGAFVSQGTFNHIKLSYYRSSKTDSFQTRAFYNGQELIKYAVRRVSAGCDLYPSSGYGASNPRNQYTNNNGYPKYRVFSGTFVTQSYTANGFNYQNSTCIQFVKIADFRIKKNVKQDGPFVPPTSLVAPDANTILCMDFSYMSGITNNNIFDYSQKRALRVFGNSQVSATNKKYGTKSLYFDGNWYLQSDDCAPFGMDYSNFTIEAFVKPDFTKTEMNIFSFGSSSVKVKLDITSAVVGTTPQKVLRIYSSAYTSPGTKTGTSNLVTSVSADGWMHVAVVRDSDNYVVYLNGVPEITISCTSHTYGISTDLLTIGHDGTSGTAYSASTTKFFGYIDEVRFTKGKLYVQQFTPPTQSLSAY